MNDKVTRRQMPQMNPEMINDPMIRAAVERRIQAPELPSAMDLGCESHPRRIITVKVEMTVEDVPEGYDLEYLNGTIVDHKAKYVTTMYDEGPIQNGSQLALAIAEMHKEVWELNDKRNTEPLSKPMEEK